MIRLVRGVAKRLPALRNFAADHLEPLGIMDRFILKSQLNEDWQGRVADAINSQDNDFIPRVPNAGEVRRGVMTMHNGLKVGISSYYGHEIAQLLLANRGVHEPQEERVFLEVLPAMPAGATMIELGSYWSFYSMWFQSVVPGARNFMVEPDPFNMKCGIRNFRLNHMKGDFTNAYVGKDTLAAPPTICIDQFVQDKAIDHIDMLHCDIQGFEFDMLQGGQRTLDAKKVDYLFISTHTNELHEQCLEFLRQRNFFIIAQCDLDDAYSADGMIAAHAPSVSWNREIPISLKRRDSQVNGSA